MIKLATVFSGIGAIEMALKYLDINYDTVFACDNGERILPQSEKEIVKIIDKLPEDKKQTVISDLYNATGKENFVKQSYMENYHLNDSRWYEDIRFLSGKKYKNNIDLYVGGSPCQSFSVNGKRAGLKDIRGTLFYEYARIIKESLPKVFIYENVRGMFTHDNGDTWRMIKSIFDELNYNIFVNVDSKGKESPILNSKNYGIPQSRERIFVVGFRKDLNIVTFKFPIKIDLHKTVKEFLEEKVDAKYYLGQKGFEFVTTHPSRAQVNGAIMRCQKANQQFNWNGDFIFEPLEILSDRDDVLNKAYISEWHNETGVIRKFTPRECLRLMGFHDNFKIIHKDEIMYRQIGNSIVVNVLMELVESIQSTGVWKND